MFCFVCVIIYCACFQITLIGKIKSNSRHKICLYRARLNLVDFISKIIWSKTQENKFGTTFALFIRLQFRNKFYKWNEHFVFHCFLFYHVCRTHSFIFIWGTQRSEMHHCQCSSQNAPLRLTWHQILSTNPSPAFMPLLNIVHSVADYTDKYLHQCVTLHIHLGS